VSPAEPSASHTGVHRVARRFLEPAQDVIVLGIGLAPHPPSTSAA